MIPAPPLFSPGWRRVSRPAPGGAAPSGPLGWFCPGGGGGNRVTCFSYWGLSLGPAVGGCAGRAAQGTLQRKALNPDMFYDNALVVACGECKEIRDAFEFHAAMLITL